MYNCALNVNAATVSISTQAEELVTHQSAEKYINFWIVNVSFHKQFKVSTHRLCCVTLNFIQVSPTHFCSRVIIS